MHDVRRETYKATDDERRPVGSDHREHENTLDNRNTTECSEKGPCRDDQTAELFALAISITKEM